MSIGTTKLDGLSFNQWMNQVDGHVQHTVGLSVHDLPDCNFMDWYLDEMPAKEAAVEVLNEAGYDGGFTFGESE